MKRWGGWGGGGAEQVSGASRASVVSLIAMCSFPQDLGDIWWHYAELDILADPISRSALWPAAEAYARTYVAFLQAEKGRKEGTFTVKYYWLIKKEDLRLLIILICLFNIHASVGLDKKYPFYRPRRPVFKPIQFSNLPIVGHLPRNETHHTGYYFQLISFFIQPNYNVHQCYLCSFTLLPNYKINLKVLTVQSNTEKHVKKNHILVHHSVQYNVYLIESQYSVQYV